MGDFAQEVDCIEVENYSEVVVSKVNFKPKIGEIVVTANLEKFDTSLILPKDFKPSILTVQQVLATGEHTDVNVGDWILIEVKKFIKHVKTKSTIRAGIGGEDMITEQLVLPFFTIPGDEQVYLKLNGRDIEGVIPDVSKIFVEGDSFTTMSEFNEYMLKNSKEMNDVWKENKVNKESKLIVER